LGLATITAMLALLDLRVVRVTVPAMVVLGLLMVAQYLFWTRRLGDERTTWQYQHSEPLRGPDRIAGRSNASPDSQVRVQPRIY
jgi:hypothetical protein